MDLPEEVDGLQDTLDSSSVTESLKPTSPTKGPAKLMRSATKVINTAGDLTMAPVNFAASSLSTLAVTDKTIRQKGYIVRRFKKKKLLIFILAISNGILSCDT
jgi:hypothetical protein